MPDQQRGHPLVTGPHQRRRRRPGSRRTTAASTRSTRASSGSSQSGPTPAMPQSTKTIDPSGRCSRLSLRMSQCTRCAGLVVGQRRDLLGQVAGPLEQPPRHEVGGHVAEQREARRPPAEVLPQVEQATGVGVGCRGRRDAVPASTAASSSVASSSRRIDASSAGRGGCLRRPRAAAPPSHRRRTTPAGPPTAGGRRAGGARSISRRNRVGVSGLRSVPTALTKARVPSAHRPRVAQPGDIPPSCSSRETTGDPSVSSTHARTAAGIASYGARTPTARGAVTASPGARRASPSTPAPCQRWCSRMNGEISAPARRPAGGSSR